MDGKLFKIPITKDLPKSVIRLYYDSYLRLKSVLFGVIISQNTLMFQME